VLRANTITQMEDLLAGLFHIERDDEGAPIGPAGYLNVDGDDYPGERRRR
jgi:hypothetical protein